MRLAYGFFVISFLAEQRRNGRRFVGSSGGGVCTRVVVGELELGLWGAERGGEERADERLGLDFGLVSA